MADAILEAKQGEEVAPVEAVSNQYECKKVIRG